MGAEDLIFRICRLGFFSDDFLAGADNAGAKNSLGDDDTTTFHVAVIESDRPLAITSRFDDTSNSVE